MTIMADVAENPAFAADELERVRKETLDGLEVGYQTPGTIATILFFHATAMVQHDAAALGAVEAMQAAEILFSTCFGIVLLGEAAPHGVAAFGTVLVALGIVALGWLVGRRSAGDARATRTLRTDRGA